MALHPLSPDATSSSASAEKTIFIARCVAFCCSISSHGRFEKVCNCNTARTGPPVQMVPWPPTPSSTSLFCLKNHSEIFVPHENSQRLGNISLLVDRKPGTFKCATTLSFQRRTVFGRARKEFMEFFIIYSYFCARHIPQSVYTNGDYAVRSMYRVNVVAGSFTKDIHSGKENGVRSKSEKATKLV